MKNRFCFLLVLTICSFFFITCKNSVDSNDTEPVNYPPADTTPPGKVMNVSVTSGDRSVQLSWENPADSDFSAIEITFSPRKQNINQPIIVEGTPESTSGKIIEGLTNGTKYTFTLVAVDENNNKSEGVTVTVIPVKPADFTPPEEVTGLSVTEKHHKVILTWTNPTDVDFKSVEISATPAEGSLDQPVIVTASPSTQESLTVSDLQNGKEYTFTIKTVDRNNNKSDGIIIKGTPVESKISLTVSLPNDSENIVLTNDKAPIEVSVTSTNPVTRAVWRHPSSSIDYISAVSMLNNSTDKTLSLDFPTIFYVTENGFYDIAVRNEEGVVDFERVEVKTIDKAPLDEVSTVVVSCDKKRNINLSWVNPVLENEYDSPLKKLKISYVYNDNEFDANNNCIELSSDKTDYSFALPDEKNENDYVKVTIQSVDSLGNISSGVTKTKWCSNYIKGTIEEVSDEIINMKSSGKVSLVGKCNLASVKSLLDQLYKKSSSVEVDLDLSSVTNLSSIKERGFYCCYNLRSIIIPEGITTLGAEAFYSCGNLTSITIPVSLVTIDNHDVFYGCYNLKRINYSGNINQWLEKSWSACNLTIGYDLYMDNKKVTDLIIPSTMDSFSTRVFGYCGSLKNITFSNTTKIQGGAFCSDFCYKDLHVNFLGTLSQWCNGIAASRSDNSVFEQYYLSINGQEQIDIQIPDDVSIVTQYAFYGCLSIKKIMITGNTKTIECRAFCGCRNLSEVKLCDGIENLGIWSFGKTDLTSVTIPGSIKNIEFGAFCECENLQEVIILEGVENIGEKAFYACKKLGSVTIPEGVKKIESIAFKECEKLANIIIPSSVNYIETGAFLECSKSPELSINFADKAHEWYFGEKFSNSPYYNDLISYVDLMRYLKDKTWASKNICWKKE